MGNFLCIIFSLTKARAHILCICEKLIKARNIKIYSTGFAIELDKL